jgi:two-component system response regulator YesN
MYKVLIIDDELIVRVGLKSIVDWESHGFVVVGEASNGEEALTLCEALQPDLILTDIKMPKMDGLTFVKEATERWSHLKIIILSAWNEFELLQQAIRYGVKDYVMKMSFNPEELATILLRMRTQLDQQHLAHSGQRLIQSNLANVGLALKESFFRRALRDQLLILKHDPDVPLKTGRTANQAIYIIGADRSLTRTVQSPKLL